jgi:hypothetical protein
MHSTQLCAIQVSLSQMNVGYEVTFVCLPVLSFSELNWSLEGSSLACKWCVVAVSMKL